MPRATGNAAHTETQSEKKKELYKDLPNIGANSIEKGIVPEYVRLTLGETTLEFLWYPLIKLYQQQYKLV